LSTANAAAGPDDPPKTRGIKPPLEIHPAVFP
jgi:hypothetical protein